MPQSNRNVTELEKTELTGAEKLAGVVFGVKRATAPGRKSDRERVMWLPRAQIAAANSAITVRDSLVVITKGGLCALTLAAPTAAQNGTRIEVVSTTAYAHTITTPSNLMHWGDSGGADDVATFAAFAGASLVLVAYEGQWHVLGRNNVTLA